MDAQVEDRKWLQGENPPSKLGDLSDVINPPTKKVRVKKPKPEIRVRKRRARKAEMIRSPKMISEEKDNFRVQFPEKYDEQYGAELAEIKGAYKPAIGARILFDPDGSLPFDTPEDQKTYCSIWKVRISEETIQLLAKFGKKHNFDFDSDIALRAQAASEEGKELYKLSYAKRYDALPEKKFKFGINPATKKPFELLKFQPASIAYALKMRRGFVADEMGLGKTITAIGTMAYDNENVNAKGFIEPWLIVVPASLRINWYKEVRKWLPKKFHVAMIKNKFMKTFQSRRRPGKELLTRESREWLADQHVLIMTYDKVHRFGKYLDTLKYRGIIFDESHYLKGRSTKRSITFKAFVHKVDPEFCLLLSGTPAMNKPMDLIGQLQVINRLSDFGGFNHFLVRYCSISTTNLAHVSNIHKAGKVDIDTTTTVDEDGTETVKFDISKAMSEQQAADKAVIRQMYQNMEALNKALRSTCYVRREKEDVLKDLPAKSRQTIALDITNRRDYEAIEADVIGYLSDKAVKEEKFLASIKKLPKATQEAKIAERRSAKAMMSARAEALVKIEALKQCAAVGKLKAVREWIESFLESGKKLVVFARHRIILDELEAMFPESLSIRANMSPERRNEAVEQFQTDDDKKLIFVGLKLAVGLTLTAASDTCTIELDWNPAAHDQAEDRVHRIGQKKSVVAYYLVASRTIEEKIGKLIEEKRRIVNATVDGDALRGSEQGSILGDLLGELTGRLKL